MLQQIRPYLASSLRTMCTAINWDTIEEIRLRIGKPLICLGGGEEYGLNAHGRCRVSNSYLPSGSDIDKTLQLMTNNSWYAREAQIQAGYLTLPGGHRVGIGGQITLVNGQIKNLSHPNSLNIRVARQILFCAQSLMSYIISQGQVLSTLLISPPGCGKTTLLRDIAREVSKRGYQTVIVDERSEIAACFQGEPQLDVGPRTDVIDACPKALGISVALRALGPQVIVTDEIGHPDDGAVLADLARAGVKVIASCHGSSFEGVKNRAWAKENLEIFERVILLSNRRGPGTVEKVLKLDVTE